MRTAKPAMPRRRPTWRSVMPTCSTSAIPTRPANLRLVRQKSEVLADYADFLAAEAEHDQGNEAAAEALLHGFNDRHPDSIFDVEAPELEANVLLAQGNATGAERVLAGIADDCGGSSELRTDKRQSCVCAGAGAGSGGLVQAVAAVASIDSRGRSSARQADGDGRGEQPDRGRTAQPGRRVL